MNDGLCCACQQPIRRIGRAPDGEVWRCSACGSLRLLGAPEPTAHTTRAYEADYQAGADPDKPARLLAHLHALVGPPAPGATRLLDVGCGDGAFLAAVQSAGWDGYGLEPDEVAVAQARQRGLRVLCGAADANTALTGPFDVVTAWDVLEHVSDPPATMTWLRQRLRPGGALIILTPNAGGWLDRLAWCEHRGSGGRSHQLLRLCLNRYHRHRLTARGLAALCRRCSLSLERSQSVQLFSLRPAQYFSGFAPGIAPATHMPRLNRWLSRSGYWAIRQSGICNKLLVLARRDDSASIPALVRGHVPFRARAPHDLARVALIRPPVNRARLYSRWYRPLCSREPSLGLVYIASWLRGEDYPVEILDGEQLGENALLTRLRQSQPDVIGLTCTTFSFFAAAKLARSARAALPHARIVLGGAHASALPAESLALAPELDACVRGEGEETLCEITSGAPWDQIAGVTWRTGGTVRHNPARPPPADLDRYRLRWELLDGFPRRYQPTWQSRRGRVSVGLVASRGCPYRCTFCAGPSVFGHRRRAHSPAYTVDMMEDARRQWGAAHFYFHDDHFTADRVWLTAFCELLLQKGAPLEWACASRVEPLTSELLALMRRAGCREIGVGLESGSPAVLKTLNKGITADGLLNGLHRIHHARISTKVYVIVGAPGERHDDHCATIALLARARVDDLQVIYYTPLPGSPSWSRTPIPPDRWPALNLLHRTPGTLPISALHAAELRLYSAVYGPQRWPGRLMTMYGNWDNHHD